MHDLLIPILTFLSVILIGSAVLVVKGVRRQMIEQRLFGHRDLSASDLTPRDRSGLVRAVTQMGQAVTPEEPATDLRTRLLQAGHYDESSVPIYLGAQLFMVLLALPIGALLAFSLNLPLAARMSAGFAVVALMGLVPNLILSLERHQRTGEVRRNLPDAIDLLEICVSSGMGLDMAWNAVTDEIRGVSPILADEMALANLEMHLGAQRAEALRHMAHRTGVEDVSSLVATLVQSERFGTSVSQALRTYADAMRTERSQRAEEAAEKLAVTLLFPMVGLIFPCMFIVILGPAVIKIYQVFANG